MRALDELGMTEADLAALATDAPERPKELRRPPAPTPASEERQRLEERDRAEYRARRIANVADDETLDEVAERLEIDSRLADEVYDHATNRRPLRPETLHRLGALGRRRPPRSEMVAALGGEEALGEIAEAFAAEARGRVAPADRGTGVEPLTRTGAETREFLGELAEADREHVA
jgi:hypothetical protein